MLPRPLLATLALAALPALADYNAGVSAYARKDFPTARQAFLEVAKLADAGAQRALSSMYARGEGGEVDLIEAYAWSSLAAEQGDATGQKIRDAVLAGLPAAMKAQAEARLADYRAKYSADAVQRNLHPISNAAEPAVFDWQLPAARLRKQGNVEYPERAQEKGEQGYACVGFFVDSNGTPRAIRRYANKGSGALAAAAEKSLAGWQFEPEPGERQVGYCVTFLIEDDKTWRNRDQLRAEQAKVRKGDARAATEFARALASAQHNPTDRVEPGDVTDAWLQAALAGSAEAQFELASRLLRGDGCVIDREKALRWLQLALNQNYEPAQQFVALRLGTEKTLAVTPAQQQAWLQAAADAGNFEAQLLRAKQLLRPGPEQNASAALALLSKLDAERHLHVRDWRAYAHGLLGEFGDGLDEAEDALEFATEAGLATATRQAAVDALDNDQIPPLPAH
ncbi:MAG: TonB family protein [Permianibacter sp.]